MFLNGNEIIFEGKKRYYVEDLTKRDFSLENTVPHILKINDYEINENSWVELIRNLAAYLLTLSPSKESEVLGFKVQWSKCDIFSCEDRTNFKQLDTYLYINCNHTSLHSCWLVQDLLDYFGTNKGNVRFIIHRPPSSEPKECRSYFASKFKEKFSLFLETNKGKTKETSAKIITNIEKAMDPILAKFSKSYDSFMLFDDNAIFYNYSMKFLQYINNCPTINPKNKLIFERYIGYLREFYSL